MKTPLIDLDLCRGEMPSRTDVSPVRTVSTGRQAGSSQPTSGVRKKRFVVGVILGPDSQEIDAGISRASRELKWSLVRWRTGSSQHFDGMISCTTPDTSRKIIRGLECPVVRLQGSAGGLCGKKPADGVPTVTTDHEAVGRMGAKHLLSLGLTHFFYLRETTGNGGMAECESFLDACREAGHEPEAIVAAADGGERRTWLKDQISRLPLPCAVMTSGDIAAMETIEAALSAGLRVPEDVAVLGKHDIAEMNRQSPVAISSLDVNTEGLGYTAAVLLDRAMRGESVEPAYHFVGPKRVVERQSTATYFCENPGISKAVLKIRSHYSQQISVPAMARECGLSVRSLYRLYRATTGNTIGKDIMVRRMEAAAEMLRDESLKLEPIAMETGLGNAKNLCRLFKEHFGQTPGQWRASGRNAAWFVKPRVGNTDG